MMTSDLSAELDRLDKAATPSEWTSDGDRVCGPSGEILMVPLGQGEPQADQNSELIAWLRNHTDEIKAALADEGWDKAMCDEYIAREKAKFEEVAGRRDHWKRLAIDFEERALEAEAERDRLLAKFEQAVALIDEYDGPDAPFADHHKWAAVRDVLRGNDDHE